MKLAESRATTAHVQELSARLSEKDKLLSERTAELSAAQAFLTRVDAVSEAEVVGMVENLNTLISSASGALSDTWDQRTPVPGALIEEPGAGQIRDYFGSLVFEQVTLRNPVAVTLAVEMYLVQYVVSDGADCRRPPIHRPRIPSANPQLRGVRVVPRQRFAAPVSDDLHDHGSLQRAGRRLSGVRPVLIQPQPVR